MAADNLDKCYELMRSRLAIMSTTLAALQSGAETAPAIETWRKLSSEKDAEASDASAAKDLIKLECYLRHEPVRLLLLMHTLVSEKQSPPIEPFVLETYKTAENHLAKMREVLAELQSGAAEGSKIVELQARWLRIMESDRPHDDDKGKWFAGDLYEETLRRMPVTAPAPKLPKKTDGDPDSTRGPVQMMKMTKREEDEPKKIMK
ncbi:MAG: hypothetical protein ACOVQ0_06660 [Novosphingobium sp.]|uniref:hypothetical protein n=1 Tax=Novosphingobium sp. TaxID=1874826 RepID=UPI003B9A5F43